GALILRKRLPVSRFCVNKKPNELPRVESFAQKEKISQEEFQMSTEEESTVSINIKKISQEEFQMSTEKNHELEKVADPSVAYSLYTYQNYRAEKTCLQSTMYNLNSKSKSFQTNTQQFPIPKGKVSKTQNENSSQENLQKKLEQCLASYRTTFKDMQRSLKRKAPSDDAFPNLFAKNDDEIIRTHTDLIEAIFEALPDIDFKQLYRDVKAWASSSAMKPHTIGKKY
ncbi:hypothetical protein CEXT_167531, partial [Caerostris extrusa]